MPRGVARKISWQRLFSPARCRSPRRPASNALAAAKGNPIALEFLTEGEVFPKLHSTISVGTGGQWTRRELFTFLRTSHSRGVEVIGLSTENPDASAEKVRKFIQDFQIDYRIGWAPVEVGAPLMQGHDAIPQIFVISRDGRILKHFVGFSPANTYAELKQALEEALN